MTFYDWTAFCSILLENIYFIYIQNWAFMLNDWMIWYRNRVLLFLLSHFCHSLIKASSAVSKLHATESLLYCNLSIYYCNCYKHLWDTPLVWWISHQQPQNGIYHKTNTLLVCLLTYSTHLHTCIPAWLWIQLTSTTLRHPQGTNLRSHYTLTVSLSVVSPAARWELE